MQQQQLVAGDTLNFLATAVGYSAADGWVLNYRLVPRSAGASAIDIVSTAEGDDHRVQIAAATTASWTAGEYGWTSWVAKDGEKYTVQSGHITIKPDPRTAAAGVDLRSMPRKTLDDLLAARATWAATHGRTRRYKIGDREREFANAAELSAEIDFWVREVAKEERAARVASGQPDGRRVYIRLNRL